MLACWSPVLTRNPNAAQIGLTATPRELDLGPRTARADSPHSWTVPVADIKQRSYDLKAVNPTARADGDRRTPDELLDLIEAQGREVAGALAVLRGLTGNSSR